MMESLQDILSTTTTCQLDGVPEMMDNPSYRHVRIGCRIHCELTPDFFTCI